MKHMCYLTSCYSRYDVLIFERQGRSLAKAGFKVTYIVCDLEPNETIDGVNIVSIGYMPDNRLKRMFWTKHLLLQKAIEIDADIYQISEPESISLGVKLKKNGKKVVFNLRENYPAIIIGKPYLPVFSQPVISKLLEIYMKREIIKYDVVFSVTTDLTDVLENKWKVRNSYLLANYPIVNNDFNLSLEEYNKRENTLCYIGTVYKISLQEHLFKALENLPNVKYIIAGVIDENYDSVIKNLPYWTKVKFINSFKKAELPSIFAQSTISNVLRDFSKTGTPNGSLGVIKMFESMEAALPIICSDVTINRLIVEKYNCGICVNPNNANEIETAIRYLAENRELAYKMGQNGRKAVIDEFNWENQSKKYIEVLNKL